MIKRLVSALALLTLTVTSAFSQSMIITGGNDHGIALCSKGQIFAWGYNNGNRLCLASPNDGLEIAPSPCLVNTGNLTFSMLSAGSGGHSVALSCYKVVYCWGSNDHSQCGRASTGEKDIVSGTPIPVPCGQAPGYTEDGQPGGKYLGNVKYISATTAASMAILDDGTGRVVIWGGNLSSGGGVIETETATPVFICDAKGNPIENVIHITGGDNNIMLIVGDSPDAKVGTVYSIGNWNGRGGNGSASSYTAAPVEIGDGTGKKSSGKYLTNVRNCGISDVGAFAVDGSTGYVYGWGNGGWGCSNGLPNNNTTTYAEKVSSGEYEDISGETYLTNVTQVVGGNGNGAAVTEDGYVLYWGCNDAAKGTTRSGGVIPNSTYATASSTCSTGPVFANYCAGEKGTKEVRVDDAVAIARGDLYGFIVNRDGDFYTWGSTARPGNDSPAHVGTLGVGETELVSTCFRKIEINCTPQDLCPEAFMNGPRYKCPNEVDSLYSGFTPTNGSENNYYFQWTKDGDVLNSSKSTDPLATRKADKYNQSTIEITEAGVYRVDIFYVGTNVPCDNCPGTFAEIEVIDMQMPIDTLIPTSCVAEPLKPSAADQISYEFTVNNNFYKKGISTSWQVYSKKEGGDPLFDEEMKVNVGSNGKFVVTGDKVTVNDNAPVDTTYSIWVEDVTKQEMHIFKGQTTDGSGSFQSYGLILDCWNDAELASFDLSLKSYSGTATAEVTPVIYKAALNNQGQYVVGSVFAEGPAQTVEFGDTPTNVTIDCGGISLPGNSARGVRYVLGMKFTGNCNMYTFKVDREQNSPLFTTSVPDDLSGTAVYAIGCTANQYNSQANGSDVCPYINITFSKLTEYDCGRIELTSKYWCPPCNQPDGIIEIASTIEAVNDTVALCKETGSTTLSVENVVKASEPTASFDIMWFTDHSMVDTKAIQSDPASTKSSITVKWDDVPEGTSQTYYMKIRDAEKPDASSCWVIDSIVVKANKVPVAPEITIDPYCEGKLTADEFLTIASKFLTLDGYTVYSLLNDSGTELKGDGIAAVASVSADLQALTAGEHKYTMTVQDAVTGCMSEPAEIPITVYTVPEAPTTSDLSMLKAAGVKESVASGATAAEGCTITWATKPDFSDGVATAPYQDKSEAGTFTYYVKQTSADGCESDSAHFTVIVNDAPMPNTRDTIICLGDAVDLSTRVSALSSEYQLNWYTTETAEKGTGSTEAPTFAETKPGVYTYYVSQTNTTTTAESEKNKFTVTVIGVDPATVVTPEVTYCKDADATSVESMISLYQDVNSYYYADATGTTWTLDGLAASATDLVPVTAVATTTSYEYTATQTYTITSSAEVCKGEPVSVKVNVTVLDAPTGELMVNYLKSDAADNGNKFKNLVAQNPNVATATTGCTLKWYDSDGLTALTSAPVPPYNADQSEDVEYTYYVSQVNADGCESEKSKVIVTISSSPMPTPNHVAYCEGDEEAAAMTANIQTTGSGKDTDADYELVWYSSNPNEVSTTAEKEALQVASAPVADVKITDGSNKQIFTYYVAQKNKNTQAVSRAIPVCDTVYAAPVLSTKNPTPVCEPATIDLSSKEIWSDAVSQNWAFAWLDESQTTPVDDPEHISQSGTFYAQAWFMVNGKKCVSNLSEIKADIHYVRNLAIEGSTTTCPNTTVDLAATYDAINPDAQAEFTWTCAGSGENTTLKSPKLTTTELAGPAGKTYTYNLSVTAGACVGISGGAHVITIGDGPIEGSVVFSEDGNTDSRTETASADGLTFYSCGGSLTIDASGVKNTGDDFVWTANGATVNTGATYTIASPANATYHLTYTNNCSTGFDIKVVSVPLAATASNTATDICENDNFSANVLVSCAENTYKIAWYHDGTEMAGQSGSDLKFSPATTDNNGTYSYKVTNRGCTFEGDIANGNALTVKPYIKFTNQTEYIARRDSQLSISLTFTEPASGEPSTIEWKEGGVNFATGNPLSLTVTADHNFNIVAQDDNYCEATGKVSVKMDARLQLSAELDNQMCSGDYRELVIDTTGTGAFVYPSLARLVVVEENADGTEREISGGWNLASDGKLHYSVSPNADTKYTVEFSYRDGDVDAQFVSVSKTLMVLPPIEIVVPEGISVCGNGENSQTIALTSVTPTGTLVTWDDDESIVSGREGTNSITIVPTFEEDRTTNFAYKTYYVRATYSICQEKTAYVTVRVDRPLKGSVVGPEIICEGNSATIDASSYDADSYSWTSAEDTTFAGSASSMITVSPTVTTAYNVDMVRGECSANDTWTVAVSYRPSIASVDSISYKSRDIQVNGGTSPYTYWIDKVDGTGSVNSTFDDLAYGSHIAYVTDEAGCSTSAPFVMYAPEIKLPPVVSPDNNGIKDRFEDPVIKSAYPNAKISIYDRWGKKLAEYSGAEDGWDGTYNGHAMPSTDYWYEVEIKELNKTYTGHFTLMRQ